MTKFIGRERELGLLKDLRYKDSASLVVITGRRRVGKSRLIAEFSRDMQRIMISGLPPTTGITAKTQRIEFAAQMARALQAPEMHSDDWGTLFWNLAEQTKHAKVVILLDEISWLGMKDPTFLGKLKNAWDLHFSKNSNLILILCGSISSWIEKNIISSTGFMGRISLKLNLKELPLTACNDFFGKYKNNISAFEKFKILSVTGGIPQYLEHILPRYSAEENIKKMCFIKEGVLFDEFKYIFHDLFATKSGLYQELLNCLIKKPQASLVDIFAILNINKNSRTIEYLDDLIMAGFVKRYYTWNLKSKGISKLSRFVISDNYIRFYLKYVLPNADKIMRDVFVDQSLSQLPGWDGIMGLQFENLVLNNRTTLWNLLRIPAADIVNDNSYFQRNTKSNRGCQIDYLLQTKYNCLYVFEIKFSKNILGIDVVAEVTKKITALNPAKNFSFRPILVHVNGVSDELVANGYFASIIDFADLLD